MRNLYLIAHTQATHHVENLVGGWHDSALTPRGLEDAQLLAAALREHLSEDGGMRLFSSDLLRAQQTAAPIGKLLGVDILTDPDLREQSYGIAEGTPAGSIPYLPPPARGDRLNHRSGVAGSETRREWAVRVYAALERILAAEARNTVVVTHGGSATYLIAAWIGLRLPDAGYVKFQVSPGSITHLREDDFDHDRQVVALNLTGCQLQERYRHGEA
ncbi:putative phosphoglycerate mutase [Arthrobacter sp. UYP6]|uniref:histidine phosphatase family protein n=1 Tax=Arthrobacter sp. UYP6 TaxID=1756378 RepID=UPI0033933E3C